MRTILWNKQNIIPGVFMFSINAFGLPIVFGLANLIDLFGRNWEIYKTRATDQKAKKIWQKELRKYLICFPFYLVVPFEKSFLFPEEEAGLIDCSHNKDFPTYFVNMAISGTLKA